MSDWKGIVGTVAPAIAAALGGPLAGLGVSALAGALGLGDGANEEEVARAVEYAHQYGVRIHATLNTLLFDGELADAEAEARALIAAGVDALIVQDMALRRMELPVELHASTQMCNMTPEQAESERAIFCTTIDR